MLTRLETEFASISDGVGDAGSPTDIERVVLRDGSSVVIRPLAAGDKAAIASWFTGLGVETRSARFFVSFSGSIVVLSQSWRVWTTSTTRRSQRLRLTERRLESRVTYAAASPGVWRSRLRWAMTGGGGAS